MTYDDLVSKLRKLLPQDRRTLLDLLMRDGQNATAVLGQPAQHDEDSMARLADGTDPQEYVNRLRDEWHDRVKIHANSAR